MYHVDNLKSKLDKLDVDKLVSVPIDLKKLSDVVDNGAVEEDVYDELLKKINAIDTSGLFIETGYDPKIMKIKGEIPSVASLLTTANFNAVDNKITNVSNLVKETDFDTKISDFEDKNFTTSDC